MRFNFLPRRPALLALLAAGVVLGASQPLLAQDPPTTRPDRQGQDDRPRGQRPQAGTRPAQPPQQRPGQPQIGMMLDQIADAAAAVELSDEQRQKVDQLLTGARRELREMMPRVQDMTPEQRRQELQAVIGGVIEGINGVLTPEQKPKFREGIERFREEMQRGGRGQRPATRPATRPGGGPEGGAALGERVGRQLQQLAAVLEEMELTGEQDQQVNAALRELRQDIRRIVGQGAQEREVGQAVRQRMEQFRGTLEAILTPEQREQLRQKMEQRGGGPPPPPATRPGQRRGRGGGEGRGDARNEGMQPMSGMMGGSDAAAPTAPARTESEFLERLKAAPGLAVGEKMPDSLAVVTLAGKEQPLREFVPNYEALVILVGSASSPTFRDRMDDLPWLRSQIERDADILILYTREQHAAGEWTVERNKVDGVEIPQHADLDARRTAARELRAERDLKAEVVVDTMDDAVLKALVGDAPHCAALVFAPDGRLVGRQQWLDPTGLAGLVELAKRK